MSSSLEQEQEQEAKEEEEDVSWRVCYSRVHRVYLSDDKTEYLQVYDTNLSSSSSLDCVFVLLHGGGHTALSWALLVSTLASSSSSYACLAFDYRAHGKSTARSEYDLSIDTLVKDAGIVIDSCVPRNVPVVLVGHSLGGAIATRIANADDSLISALVVLDVVEGTAKAAIPHMQALLTSRPQVFSSTQQAVQWAIQSSTLSNRESANISIPAQLVQIGHEQFTWRTDLMKTKEHWNNWYDGLSKMFLSAKCAKMLVVAGRDRMDDLLTVAQMQGKFQFVLISGSGHCIQEDQPQVLADLLVQFVKRNKFKEMALLNAKLSTKSK
jgi:protein phosphatase methylesterase 1